jgi:hypothetical protein
MSERFRSPAEIRNDLADARARARELNLLANTTNSFLRDKTIKEVWALQREWAAYESVFEPVLPKKSRTIHIIQEPPKH